MMGKFDGKILMGNFPAKTYACPEIVNMGELVKYDTNEEGLDHDLFSLLVSLLLNSILRMNHQELVMVRYSRTAETILSTNCNISLVYEHIIGHI